MKTNKKYAVFILTHGRPDKVITYNALRNNGYTGDIYLICDDEDKTLSEYKKIYKDKVIVFSKDKYSGTFDIMDNFDGNKVIVFARNACNDIARSLELEYFFEYEDDYVNFSFRHEDGECLRSTSIKNLDLVFNEMINCLDSTSVSTIAFAQGGDFIGGINPFRKDVLKRKAMNSFLFKVNPESDKDLIFTGRMNDDVNTYLSNGKIGKLFFQVNNVCLVQKRLRAALEETQRLTKIMGHMLNHFTQ